MSEDVQQLLETLRRAAAEIASEGHVGWGNTCTWAADAIERLTAAVAAHKDALRQHVRGASQRVADRDAQVREAFLAGWDAAALDDYGNPWEYARHEAPDDSESERTVALAAYLQSRQPKEPA